MSDRITKDMTLAQVLEASPRAARVLAEHGFHCVGCRMASFERLEDGAAVHGIRGDELDRLIDELNEQA